MKSITPRCCLFVFIVVSPVFLPLLYCFLLIPIDGIIIGGLVAFGVHPCGKNFTYEAYVLDITENKYTSNVNLIIFQNENLIHDNWEISFAKGRVPKEYTKHFSNAEEFDLYRDCDDSGEEKFYFERQTNRGFTIILFVTCIFSLVFITCFFVGCIVVSMILIGSRFVPDFERKLHKFEYFEDV